MVSTLKFRAVEALQEIQEKEVGTVKVWKVTDKIGHREDETFLVEMADALHIYNDRYIAHFFDSFQWWHNKLCQKKRWSRLEIDLLSLSFVL